MSDEGTPPVLRDRVRSVIETSLRRDLELRGARSARLLAVAGVVGVAGAIGATLLVSGHPFGHHPPWHVVYFSVAWAGLLMVAAAIAMLGIRTPALPLARAATVGLLGLGLAGLCGALCPDPHFVAWWSATPPGARLVELGGPPLAAGCFGLLAMLAPAALASFLLSSPRQGASDRTLLPATVLLALLSPGVALQSVGLPWLAVAGWWLGTAAGVYLGVAAGQGVRSALEPT